MQYIKCHALPHRREGLSRPISSETDIGILRSEFTFFCYRYSAEPLFCILLCLEHVLNRVVRVHITIQHRTETSEKC